MLYLDTEFNGYRGELISMALASDNDTSFYAILDYSHLELNLWVKENVIPKLGSGPRLRRTEFQFALISYLSQFSSKHTIIADWPADFEHLMSMLYEDKGVCILQHGLKMELIHSGDLSALNICPHNALSDAIALKVWHQSQMNRDLHEIK